MTLFTKCVLEFVGTLVLILMGDGVCANLSLNKSKAKGAGWVVITIAWGLAVMCGVFIAGPYTGAHLNPAVTLGLAFAGMFPWSDVLGYIIAQCLGGFCGACLVYFYFKDHFDATTEDPSTLLGIFCTIPAIDHKWKNFWCEAIATWVLIFIVMAFSTKGNVAEVGLGSLGAFPVAFVIIAIGMSLGGTTGYALNPARDLPTRFAHFILPIKGKGSSNWNYCWVPILGPIAGAALAAATYFLIY